MVILMEQPRELLLQMAEWLKYLPIVTRTPNSETTSKIIMSRPQMPRATFTMELLSLRAERSMLFLRKA